MLGNLNLRIAPIWVSWNHIACSVCRNHSLIYSQTEIRLLKLDFGSWCEANSTQKQSNEGKLHSSASIYGNRYLQSSRFCQDIHQSLQKKIWHQIRISRFQGTVVVKRYLHVKRYLLISNWISAKSRLQRRFLRFKTWEKNLPCGSKSAWARHSNVLSMQVLFVHRRKDGSYHLNWTFFVIKRRQRYNEDTALQ